MNNRLISVVFIQIFRDFCLYFCKFFLKCLNCLKKVLLVRFLKKLSMKFFYLIPGSNFCYLFKKNWPVFIENCEKYAFFSQLRLYLPELNT